VIAVAGLTLATTPIARIGWTIGLRHVLFAVEATRRWVDEHVTANAVHPGAAAICITGWSRHSEEREPAVRLRPAAAE
jgi:hypothetical protein